MRRSHFLAALSVALICAISVMAFDGQAQTTEDLFAPETPTRRTPVPNAYCRAPNTRVPLAWEETYSRTNADHRAILTRYYFREVLHRDAVDPSITIEVIEREVLRTLTCRNDGGTCTQMRFFFQGDFLGSAWCGVEGPPPVGRVIPRTLRIRAVYARP